MDLDFAATNKERSERHVTNIKSLAWVRVYDIRICCQKSHYSDTELVNIEFHVSTI